MKIKSINIFGVTGGIGTAFVELIKNNNILITGYYHEDSNSADLIKIRYPKLMIQQVDLSNQFAFDNRIISNYEGLFFVAGEPHYSKNVFDFELSHLRNQININLFSFLAIVKSALKYKDCHLKKIVFVSSRLSTEINSIYHFTKILQEKSFEILSKELINRKISISIIKADWVNTKMYKKYIATDGATQSKVISPKSVAAICLKEFRDLNPFKLITI